MSLTVKKISFGNGNQTLMIQRNFGVPTLSPQTTPTQQTIPITQNTQISQPGENLPIVTSSTPVPVYQTNPTMTTLPEGVKTAGYVTAGLALLSLGISSANMLKTRHSRNISNAMDKLETQIIGKIEERLNNAAQKTETGFNNLSNKIEKEIQAREGLGKWMDGLLSDIRKNIKTTENRLNEVVSIAENKAGNSVSSNINFLTKEVDVNGQKMNLTKTLHGYGKYSDDLAKAIQEEAANRMLGLVDRSKMTPPDKITIRVPTTEFKGITSTGGMAIVPKEVMANLGAFINKKQDTRLIVDMPMFLGEVENNSSSGKQTFYALEAIGNGKFNWVSKATKADGKDSIVVGNLERIANTQIPVYDDTTRTMQNVEVYLAKGLTQEVDYNLLRQYLPPESLDAYNRSINEYLEIYRKFNSDTADLKKQIETDTEPLLNKLKDKTLSKEEKNSVENKIKEIRKPFEDLKEKFIKEHGTLWNEGFIELTGDAEGHIKAKVSFDGVFYKNEKFDMKGPRFDGKDGNKNIYNDKAINAGESERFMYFDKYFYEFLTKSKEQTTERLGADLIIGNDWHTGGISAMMRLLTKAREAVGDLTPVDAEKLQNTPIVTILHNAQLAGSTSHSNAKLFNILFGEHSAEIVENAHMPDIHKYIYDKTYEKAFEAAKKQGLASDAAKEQATAEATAKANELSSQYGLPAKCWNGLMHGNSVNPQTMATAYSDVILPVSDKYMEEIATQGVYGRENFELFRLRKFASEDTTFFPGQKTIVGITNGCDKVNNILTDEGARILEKQLGLPSGALKIYDGQENILDWHNHNKKIILDKVIAEVKDPANPMKLENPKMTDLTGVNENTMIVSTAGRIVDQKGLDIFAEAIEEFLSKNKITDGNYPVFYAQGVGDEQFIKAIMAIKEKVAKSPELGGEAAAKRIVFANLFAEPGRYDACKLMSDFSIMSSWFEPCGLVHKEIVAKSGAIPIVNKTGGLTSGLTDKVDAIFSDFKPNEGSKEAVMKENKTNFATAMGRAFKIFNDKQKLSEMMKKSYDNDFSWLVKDGPMAQYVKIFTDLKVLKPEILDSVA